MARALATALRVLSDLALMIRPCLVAAALFQTAASPSLDWGAPHRWVHLDTVPEAGVPVFEGARQRWLKTLRRDGLPDGRALFWSGDRAGRRTYLTLYPFREWGELDARSRRASETQAKVGPEAVADYDSADSVLVQPHYTQVWSRRPGDDFVSPLAGELTELTATHGRLEFLRLNYEVADRAKANWAEVREALAKQRYPLTCRAYFGTYGVGQTFRLWLAADEAALKRAPSLEDALRQALGDERGRALAREYAALWTTQEEMDVVRREELSNLVR
jgi:hypothetical protein